MGPRIAKGYPVVVQDKPDTFMVLHPDGAYQFTNPVMFYRAKLAANLPDNTWSFFDSDVNLDWPARQMIDAYFFLVQTTSPRAQYYAWVFKTEYLPVMYLMKPPTLKEILVGYA